MNTTRYFVEQVLRKRPYIKVELCRRIIAQPVKREIQPDPKYGNVELSKLGGRALRVVTLADGQTLHNAFPDRNFKPQSGESEPK